jgi:hypothetical protein
MAMGPYNGWPGKVRELRGALHSSLIKQKALPRLGHCELTGQTKGLTFHSEEYGSLWQDMLATTHELAPYCHGIIHARFSLPNRWRRFKMRLLEKKLDEIYEFNSLFQFFGTIKGLPDIDAYPDCDTGIAWLDALTLTPYDGPVKIACVKNSHGVLLPDPEIYGAGKKVLTGLVYDSKTGKLSPYSSIPE